MHERTRMLILLSGAASQVDATRALTLLTGAIGSRRAAALDDVGIDLHAIAPYLAALGPALGDYCVRVAGEDLRPALLGLMALEVAGSRPAVGRGWLGQAQVLYVRRPGKQGPGERVDPFYRHDFTLSLLAYAQGALLDQPSRALQTAASISQPWWRAMTYARLAEVFLDRPRAKAKMTPDQALNSLVAALR